MTLSNASCGDERYFRYHTTTINFLGLHRRRRKSVDSAPVEFSNHENWVCFLNYESIFADPIAGRCWAITTSGIRPIVSYICPVAVLGIYIRLGLKWAKLNSHPLGPILSGGPGYHPGKFWNQYSFWCILAHFCTVNGSVLDQFLKQNFISRPCAGWQMWRITLPFCAALGYTIRLTFR